MRCRFDAPPREHVGWQDGCAEPRIRVRNRARRLAHREERYPAERCFFAPQEEQAGDPGSNASRAEIGRDEIRVAPRTQGPGKDPSRLHSACRSELRANRCAKPAPEGAQNRRAHRQTLHAPRASRRGSGHGDRCEGRHDSRDSDDLEHHPESRPLRAGASGSGDAQVLRRRRR